MKQILDTKKKRLAFCIFVNVVLIIYILVTYVTRNGIRCPIYKLTGYYCALCGATRSTWAIMDLDFVSAYHYNAFYLFMLPYFVIRYFYSWFNFVQCKKIKTNIDFWLIFLAAIMFIIARNTFLPELQPVRLT